MTKRLTFIFFVFMCASVIFSEKTVLLPDILKPSSIVVGKTQMYVVENATIYIYGLENFKLKKKFGKRGEGPGEFSMGRRSGRNTISITPRDDKIFISNRSKVLFFSTDGGFLSEKKLTEGFRSTIKPFGSGYVALTFSGFRSSKPTQTINLQDSNFNNIRILYNRNAGFFRRIRNRSLKINNFESVFGFAVGKDRIYVMDSPDFNIKIINSKGDFLSPINIEYKKVKISLSFKSKIMDYYKNVRYKNFWDRVKSRIEIPDEFPAIQTIHAEDGRLYVQTYKRENGKTEFFIFNHSGKLDKKIMLPLNQSNAVEYFPHYIKHSKLFQLVEDEEDEEWILHITRF